MNKEWPGAMDLEKRGLIKPLLRSVFIGHEVVYTLTPEGQELAKEIAGSDLIIKWRKNHNA